MQNVWGGTGSMELEKQRGTWGDVVWVFHVTDEETKPREDTWLAQVHTSAWWLSWGKNVAISPLLYFPFQNSDYETMSDKEKQHINEPKGRGGRSNRVIISLYQTSSMWDEGTGRAGQPSLLAMNRWTVGRGTFQVIWMYWKFQDDSLWIKETNQ